MKQKEMLKEVLDDIIQFPLWAGIGIWSMLISGWIVFVFVDFIRLLLLPGLFIYIFLSAMDIYAYLQRRREARLT